MQAVMSTPATHDAAFKAVKPAMDPKEVFYRHFEAQATAIQDDIANLSNIATAGGERKDATDHILTSISRLTNEVSDAAALAPPRDQMIYNQALKALREHLNVQTSRFGPRSRFAFSPRSKERFLSSSPPRNTQAQVSASNNSNAAAAAVQQSEDKVGDLPKFDNTKGKNYNAEMASQSGTGIRKPSFSTARDIDISSHRGMHIILPATASRATTSGSITDLRNCVLDMSVPTLRRGLTENQDDDDDDETEPSKKATKKRRTLKASPFSSLAIKDISRSVIIAGRVAGPAHITGVKDAVLVVNARQVRIHECENVSVYLWAGSRPIIEDCTGMRFAEIPAQYLTSDQEPSTNQWNQVDDFNWLKSEASPNWRAITPGEANDENAIPSTFWETTVRGGPQLCTEDILHKAGIA
ncbi:tubulin-specific chaperone C [Coniella lustricola]|uniref:Tubulin-specific chaperone C n=1 Tax=Coniella lustricola TaxID=2025994 RepID=A0A2T2ZT67_9PEZI|nr:tubulin-specific chaperone C [Coniella lustricola]